ncbi:MAG TPA: hypothetical protein VG711_00660, partial [Phycisphaerales bacterium]|nr:hypothetical protein [Phycisphaerales bacterium]
MAKKSATLRVHTLAKELGVDSTAIVEKCRAEDVPNIENHMSVVPLGLAESIREWFSGSSSTAVQTSAAVDLEQARAKAKRKTSKRSTAKKKKSDDDSS